MFKDADCVNGYVIFNIRRNRYRLVTVIQYAKTAEEKLSSCCVKQEAVTILDSSNGADSGSNTSVAL